VDRSKPEGALSTAGDLVFRCYELHVYFNSESSKHPPSNGMSSKGKVEVVSDDFATLRGEAVFNTYEKGIHILINGVATDSDNITIWMLFINGKVWLKEAKFLDYLTRIGSRCCSWSTSDCQCLLILLKSSSE
jgi:hypothetical protein